MPGNPRISVEFASSQRKRRRVIAWRRIGLLALLAMGAGLVFAFIQFKRWGETPLAISEPVIIEFPRGSSAQQLAQKLEAAHIVSSATMFRVWLRTFADYSKFKAGTYQFKEQVSPRDISTMISSGKIYQPVVVQYTIPEGANYQTIVTKLLAQGIGTKEEYKILFKDPAFLKEQNVPSTTLEGFLYPATYPFVKQVSAREALSTAVKSFWARLPDGYEAAVKEKGLDLQKAVTFASLIELETKYNDEKPMVAEVIWRRLNRRQPLGIDAALIYGIADYKGDIKWSHLKDAKNLYNTRIHGGLPPTPIGSPATTALQAVLNPTDSGYYYYVLDIHNEGRHRFSRTLEEHNSAVRELVKKSRGESIVR